MKTLAESLKSYWTNEPDEIDLCQKERGVI